MVGDAQIPGHLCDRLCGVSYQSDCFCFKFFGVSPSCLGGHAVLRFHPVPPYTTVCEIGGRSALTGDGCMGVDETAVRLRCLVSQTTPSALNRSTCSAGSLSLFGRIELHSQFPIATPLWIVRRSGCFPTFST